ncbi:MAG: TRAP transporter small permease [Deltaproteobacteria bacterium]|nr:TRAP transporter small permease [Deltaproteobacteria bacterium]MBW2309020.1 TRAP transporter small permease [Deltaproteobacteria bacterium]
MKESRQKEKKEFSGAGIFRPEIKSITFLSNFSLYIAICAILTMVTLVALNTVARALPFMRPFQFVEEYSGYLLVTMAFLGLAYTLRTEGHIKMTLVTGKLPPKLRAGWEIVTTIFAILIISVLFWHALGFLITSIKTYERAQTVMLTPLWIPRLMLVPGYFFLMLEMFVHLLWKIKEFKMR